MERSAGWLQRGAAVALTMAAMMAAGCGGGGGGDGASTSTADASSGNSRQSSASNRAPTISATPATQAVVGSAYALIPSVSDPDGDTLAFSIKNRPSWAEFSTATGELKGIPQAQHIGSYADIVITVSDGSTTVALPAFTITVASTAVADTAVPEASASAPPAVTGGKGTTLLWEAPMMTKAGTPLSALAGYRIHYGTKAEVLDNTIIVSNAGTVSYSVADLPPGTYFFAVKAVDDRGTESELSNIVQLTVG
jgi:hypothetical protein